MATAVTSISAYIESTVTSDVKASERNAIANSGARGLSSGRTPQRLSGYLKR
jgi:hypothetical protein